jgi:hypothetical protein
MAPVPIWQLISWELQPERYISLASGVISHEADIRAAGIVILFMFVLLHVNRGSYQEELWRRVPLILVAIGWLFAPLIIDGRSIGLRIGVFLGPALVIAAPQIQQSWRRWLLRLAITALLGYGTIVNILRMQVFNEETRGFAELINRAEAGKRLVGLVYNVYSENNQFPVYWHMATWYQALKGGSVGRSFAKMPPLAVRYQLARAATPFASWDSGFPKSFSIDQFPDTDYLLVRSTQDTHLQDFLDRAQGQVFEEARAGTWILFRKRSGSGVELPGNVGAIAK